MTSWERFVPWLRAALVLPRSPGSEWLERVYREELAERADVENAVARQSLVDTTD